MAMPRYRPSLLYEQYACTANSVMAQMVARVLWEHQVTGSNPVHAKKKKCKLKEEEVVYVEVDAEN